MQLLHDPATAGTVVPRHLAAIVGAYPKLGIRWEPRKGGRGLELWKAVAVAVPSLQGGMSPREIIIIISSSSSSVTNITITSIITITITITIIIASIVMIIIFIRSTASS